MESLAPESRPGWPIVAAAVAVGIGILPAVFGAVIAEVASAVDGCGQFGDFGCGGFWAIGLYACPGGALGGAVVGGVTAFRMTNSGSSYSRGDVWKRSFGLAFLSLFLSAPLSLVILSLL